MRPVLLIAFALTFGACDISQPEELAPGTFTASLRGDRQADLAGSAVIVMDSTRIYDFDLPIPGYVYFPRYTVVMGDSAGFVRVVLPGEPATLSVDDADLEVLVCPSGKRSGCFNSTRGSAPRLVDLSVTLEDGELVGTFSARLTSGGNPLGGTPARQATTSGRFSATLPP